MCLARLTRQLSLCLSVFVMFCCTRASLLQVLKRATVDKGVARKNDAAAISDSAASAASDTSRLIVIDTESMEAYERGFVELDNSGKTLLKLKDYPPNMHFREALPRHSQVHAELIV
jgi:hypothetical protein